MSLKVLLMQALFLAGLMIAGMFITFPVVAVYRFHPEAGVLLGGGILFAYFAMPWDLIIGTMPWGEEDEDDQG